MQWERVVFSTKGLHQGSITGSAVFGERVPDTYVVHISMFSEELITAAEKWFSANSGNPDVIRNSAFVVRYRENALVDGVVGVSGIC